MSYQAWQPLRAGDKVAILAPASAPLQDVLPTISQLLRNWQLVPQVSEHLFGADLLCANSDRQRYQQLQAALTDPAIAAIWCLRGGYGTARLLTQLAKITPPVTAKPVIGFSDITALHLFLQRCWGWQSIHGPTAAQMVTPQLPTADFAVLKQLLFGQVTCLRYDNLKPLNAAARQNQLIQSSITGGNLSLVQTSLATPWQIIADQQILFLEEINERAYRIDRILTHLEQAGMVAKAAAILLGDFSGGNEPNGSNLIQPVLERFAKSCPIPVLQCPGIGHDPNSNHPLPLGAATRLSLGATPSLELALAGFTDSSVT